MSPATAIISVRMGSSRLPGKVLLKIMDRPMLSWQVERVRRAREVAHIVVATSTKTEDDAIASFCAAEGVDCFRGSQLDVLDRIYRAAVQFGADPIARLTGDDPMCDSKVIDRVLKVYFHGEYDYVSNVNPPTFPDGLDVEVIRLRTLEQVWREADSPEDREHVTRYIRSNLARWRTANVENDVDLSHLHWALDEGRHLAFITKAFETLYPRNPSFGLDDILALENQPV